MSFFKKLFSANKDKQPETASLPKFIATDEYIDTRYKEERIPDKIREGNEKMIRSYYVDNAIVPKVAEPLNSPLNLDQINENDGFLHYCRGFGLPDVQIIFTLAASFAAFFESEHGFKLYKDLTPDSELRGMVMKYEKNGGVLFAYPFEYALAALNGEKSFENLNKQVGEKIGNLPTTQDFLDQLKKQMGE
ncbi:MULTISPECIES: hypothetical protein [unclassified Flavobacterium]|uniref:hypothetical protein n=1 Tax=unclassified Flavobacterium TaxID=196869 RepID=UPI001F1459BC|nr:MULTISPECIES: hypothetical protein [unclassified Flavobacterium]UMY66455.1 hypothetical protein MKO97_03480 [Flavobacterium sp. HJ-32-4]